MVVVGGGFGGVQAVRKLHGAPVDVTLVDRRNFTLFQPLLYQVATGSLSPGEIAVPLRGIFKRDPNVHVLLGEVTGFDLAAKHVLLEELPNDDGRRELPYDTLVVAAGSSYSYFGHDDWRPFAPDVKKLESALDVRRRILTAFEAAEAEPDPELRPPWLTFVVVGAGPTGVEIAGQIAEIARDALRRDFRSVDTRTARILLVEPADRVLTAFPPRPLAQGRATLRRIGVTPLTGTRWSARRRVRPPSRPRAGSGSDESRPARSSGPPASWPRRSPDARRRGRRRGRPRRAPPRRRPT